MEKQEKKGSAHRQFIDWAFRMAHVLALEVPESTESFDNLEQVGIALIRLNGLTLTRVHPALGQVRIFIACTDKEGLGFMVKTETTSTVITIDEAGEQMTVCSTAKDNLTTAGVQIDRNGKLLTCQYLDLPRGRVSKPDNEHDYMAIYAIIDLMFRMIPTFRNALMSAEDTDEQATEILRVLQSYWATRKFCPVLAHDLRRYARLIKQPWARLLYNACQATDIMGVREIDEVIAAAMYLSLVSHDLFDPDCPKPDEETKAKSASEAADLARTFWGCDIARAAHWCVWAISFGKFGHPRSYKYYYSFLLGLKINEVASTQTENGVINT